MGINDGLELVTISHQGTAKRKQPNTNHKRDTTMTYMIVFGTDEQPCVIQLLGPFKNEAEALNWGKQSFGQVEKGENNNWFDRAGEPVFVLQTLIEPAR